MITSIKKPKIKDLTKKYNISLLSKDDVSSLIKELETKNDIFVKLEVSVLRNYYLQRLPVEIAKNYLHLNKKSNLTDNEIITISCIKHQNTLLQQNPLKKKIKHIIDGLPYNCEIGYNKSKCDCGVDGYVWDFPKDIKKTYWLQNEWRPIAYLKYEPYLTMLEEYNVIQNYIKKNNIKIKIDKNMINSNKRINAYPFYYQKYWEWENDNLPMPNCDEEWKKYFANTGCANHRDLIETIHINHTKKRGKNINYRYGVVIKN